MPLIEHHTTHTPAGTLHTLRLARPPVNALDPALCIALAAALRRAADEGAAGVLLAGGERVFCAGLDVPFLLGLGGDAEALRAAWHSFFEAARALAACPVPVIAALRGHAPAGGCVLALCCDQRLIAEGEVRIGLNEVQVGLAVPEGIQHLLRRVVGAQRASTWLCTGHMPNAAEALAAGLVDACLPAEEVEAEALLRLQRLAALPRQPLLTTRALARRDLVDSLAPACLDLDAAIADWYSADTQAGLHALVARLGKPG
jgi:enoyl-CoA hydratase/carnithine racemase